MIFAQKRIEHYKIHVIQLIRQEKNQNSKFQGLNWHPKDQESTVTSIILQKQL